MPSLRMRVMWLRCRDMGVRGWVKAVAVVVTCIAVGALSFWLISHGLVAPPSRGYP